MFLNLTFENSLKPWKISTIFKKRFCIAWPSNIPLRSKTAWQIGIYNFLWCEKLRYTTYLQYYCYFNIPVTTHKLYKKKRSPDVISCAKRSNPPVLLTLKRESTTNIIKDSSLLMCFLIVKYTGSVFKCPEEKGRQKMENPRFLNETQSWKEEFRNHFSRFAVA